MRPLEAVYPIVYLDALRVKIRYDGSVQNRCIYLAIGVNLEGKKETLGLWTAKNEGAKFWFSVLTELNNRGVSDIFIACVDGLKGKLLFILLHMPIVQKLSRNISNQKIHQLPNLNRGENTVYHALRSSIKSNLM